MNRDPFVDVIMPNYNKGEFLEESINSVLAQEYKNWNLFVIDNSSNDNSKEILNNASKTGSILGGHPEYLKVPGIEASTGALGHGLPIAVGMSLAAKIKREKHKIYVIVGDGEINEGSIWEAALAASKHNLSNFLT